MLLLCTSRNHAQDLDNPGAYMTALSNAHLEMNKKYLAYVSAAAHGKRAKKIEKMRKETLESIENSRMKTIDLPYYKGDNSLRQSSIDYIQLCYKVFNEDYANIVNMEEIAEQSFDEMQAYLLLKEKTNEKLSEAGARLSADTKAFATKYNVKIIDTKDELSDKMDMAGKVSHYNNQVYLLFFKCYWQYSELAKAIESKKISDIEQKRNSLLRYAEEGFRSLDTTKPFNGDNSLINACRQVLTYYKKTAENDISKIGDFLLKSEAFEKQKKIMEQKNNHTKEEVDAYNKAVADINKAAQSYNQINQQMYATYNQVLENWNEAERVFNDTHTPHYK